MESIPVVIAGVAFAISGLMLGLYVIIARCQPRMPEPVRYVPRPRFDPESQVEVLRRKAYPYGHASYRDPDHTMELEWRPISSEWYVKYNNRSDYVDTIDEACTWLRGRAANNVLKLPPPTSARIGL